MIADVDLQQLKGPPPFVRFERRPVAAALGAIFVVPRPFADAYYGPAELPRAEVDTTFHAVTGSTYTVSNDNASGAGSMAAALASAVGGDEIVIGTNLTRPIDLPDRGDSGVVLIRSDNAAWLSASSTRVTSATNMRSVTASGSPLRAVTTQTAAHGYRFVGIEFKFPSSGVVTTTLIEIGNGESSLSDLPDNIIFDRCYVHGDSVNYGRRGFALNGTNCAVINSYLFDFNEAGSDSQCIWLYNTPGPILVENTFLYGGAENFMTGGAHAAITGLIPSDITIRKCHFKRNLALEDSALALKNLFELKVGDRVLVEKCLFENQWQAAQAFAWNIKTVNQDAGPSTWNVTQNVTMRHNKVMNVEGGISLAQREVPESLSTNKVSIYNNLFVLADVQSPAPSEARFMNWLGDMVDVYIRHNTVVNSGSTPQGIYWETATAAGCSRFTFIDNLIYGDIDGPGPSGDALFQANCPTYVCTNNGFIAGGATYSGTNVLPANNAAAFTDVGALDYTVKSGSSAENAASDGTDMGCDVAAVEAYAAAALSGA